MVLQSILSLWWGTNWFLSFLDAIHIMFNWGWGVVSNRRKQNYKLSCILAVFFSCQFIMFACFSGQMFSKLMNKSKVKNIDNLEDLIARPELKIIVYKGTPFEDFIIKVKEQTNMTNPIDTRVPSPNPADYIQVAG